MWNEKTKSLVADGKLVVVGVIQEQHAERCRLYRQWKQYEFPIVQDSFTGLGLAVVPVPVLIDEYGIVMNVRPRVSKIEQLVNQATSPPKSTVPKLNPEHVTADWIREKTAMDSSWETLCALGDANVRLATLTSVESAIDQYRQSLARCDSNAADESWQRGALNFRVGVASRMLFDLTEEKSQDPNDFSAACRYWSNALAENPNQYIWRRRIQQYGPRQIKPYPFYDWVEQANREIAERGETPVRLKVPLTGSEIAQPNRTFVVSDERLANPDPDGKITRDDGRLVKIHSTVVPASIRAGKSVRVHLRFSPNDSVWNNEVDDLAVWINDSKTGKSSEARLSVSNMKEPSSAEVKMLEFEFQTNDEIADDATISGYVLYYVCESDGSQCLYRRQDFLIPVAIDQK